VRFLHTSDWHVGKAIRGRSRNDEYAAALDEVVAIAVDERVDVVLLAGDVYEHRVAAPEADSIVFDALLRLHGAGVRVVVVPGNHDSGVRFEALGKLLHPLGTEVVHRVLPPGEGGVLEVPSRDGTESAAIACVPFVPERRFGDAAELFRAGEAWHLSYADGMGRLLGAMAAGFRSDRVNIVLAHLFADGALLGGGERPAAIGDVYAVPPSRLPADAAYVALGHVHRPQVVAGSPAPTRYAGSLVQLDFGEVDQRKSVAIVEASPGKPAKVREVHLAAGRRLLDLHGTLDEVVAKAGGVGDAFLRVFVKTDGPVPGMADRVREVLPNALDVKLEYERADSAPTVAPVSSLHPRDQFVAYYRSQHGAEPSGELVDAFDEVLRLETEEA
jgi:exonuclease SbcD